MDRSAKVSAPPRLHHPKVQGNEELCGHRARRRSPRSPIGPPPKGRARRGASGATRRPDRVRPSIGTSPIRTPASARLLARAAHDGECHPEHDDLQCSRCRRTVQGWMRADSRSPATRRIEAGHSTQRTAAKPTVVERDLIRAAIHAVPHRLALADHVSGGSGSMNSILATLTGLLPGCRIAGLVAEYGAVAHAAHLLPRVDAVDDPRKLPRWLRPVPLTASATILHILPWRRPCSGDTTMRLGRLSDRSLNGENSVLMTDLGTSSMCNIRQWPTSMRRVAGDLESARIQPWTVLRQRLHCKRRRSEHQHRRGC